MGSPFPGMDPYLEDEKRWPAFQPVLVQALYQMLLPGLMDRYRARVGERLYCSEQALFTSIIREQHKEAFIEVRQRSDGRLITLVEVVSPGNKITAKVGHLSGAARGSQEDERQHRRNRSGAARANANRLCQGRRPDLGLRRGGDALDAPGPLRDLLRDLAETLAEVSRAAGFR